MSEITAVPLRPIARNGLVALWIGIAVLVLGGLGAGWWMSGGAVAAVAGGEEFLRYNGARHGVVTTASGLQYQVLRRGAGPRPTISDIAVVEYKGMLTNGAVFDQSQPGKPVPMQINHVIPGFSEGLMLMPKGSVYRFWIPAKLGYGDQQAGPIPPNSVLVFDVTMHEAVSLQGVTQAQGE